MSRPESAPEDARLIDFNDLGNQAEPYLPQEGDVITGLHSSGAINALEERILKWVNPGFYGTPQHRVVREPLSCLLQPSGYPTAQLRRGIGVLMLENGNLFVAADIFSRGRKQGMVGCHVRYSRDTRNLTNVIRKLQHIEITEGLDEALERVRTDSANMAGKVAANGLRQVVLVGLPTLGKCK
jgi:hypothetical protein